MVDYVRSIRSNHRTLPPFFSTSDMDKLGKVRRRHWEVRLNISKLAKFESECLKERTYSKAKLRKFKDVCMGRGVGGKFAPPPHHTNVVKFCNFEELYMYLR